MSAYRPWDVDQPMLLPPSVPELVPPSHLVHFVRDLVQRELDLAAVHARYSKDPRGNAPYHPGMMTALLVYSYCKGIASSRGISSACEERAGFMALTGMQQPDFRTVADFRKLHLDALASAPRTTRSSSRHSESATRNPAAEPGSSRFANPRLRPKPDLKNAADDVRDANHARRDI